jgi:hypothetical protein
MTVTATRYSEGAKEQKGSKWLALARMAQMTTCHISAT